MTSDLFLLSYLLLYENSGAPVSIISKTYKVYMRLFTAMLAPMPINTETGHLAHIMLGRFTYRSTNGL